MDTELAVATRLAMRVASLGRAARSKAGIRVRQPLAAVLVKARTPEEGSILAQVADQVRDELNVKEVRTVSDETELLAYQVRPNMAALGKKYGAKSREVAVALAALDPALVVSRLQAGANVQAGEFTLLPEEVNVGVLDRPGFATASESGYTVAVTTEVTPELAREGLARELVHRIQNMRRSAGFEIADRIVTYFQGPETVHQAMEAFASYVKTETLSLELRQAPPPDGAYVETQRIDGQDVVLAVKRV
jgi:isoleucyl-tRNA synthetase